MPLRPETRTRARALQLLYAWETDGQPPVESLLPGLARITRSRSDILAGATALAAGVVARREAIDSALARAADHWRLERLAMVDRNILRLGAYELMAGLVPPKVAIDEALWLAHRFGGGQTPGFVNGVLDAVARSLGKL